MATENLGRNQTFLAGGDYSSSQYYLVEASTTHNYVNTVDSTTRPAILGVLQNDPSSDQAAIVEKIAGQTSKIAHDGTCAIGGLFMASSAGLAISSTSDATANRNLYGPVLNAGSTVSGTYIEAVLAYAGLTT